MKCSNGPYLLRLSITGWSDVSIPNPAYTYHRECSRTLRNHDGVGGGTRVRPATPHPFAADRGGQTAFAGNGGTAHGGDQPRAGAQSVHGRAQPRRFRSFRPDPGVAAE